MRSSIPIEQVNKRRWSLLARVLVKLQVANKELLDMKKLSIVEDEHGLHFIYDEENENGNPINEID